MQRAAIAALLVVASSAGAGCGSRPGSASLATLGSAQGSGVAGAPVARAAASPDPVPAASTSGGRRIDTSARGPVAMPEPGAAGPADASGQKRYVVAAIGDSLTDPRSHGGGYLEVLRQRCPESRFESYGVGGNMANMMRRRFLRDVFGEDPPGGRSSARPAWTHVIILGGLGDVISNLTAKRSAASIQRDIGWMVEETHRRGARALVMTLPPWAGASQYDGVRAQIARDVNGWILGETGKSIDASFDTRPILSCGRPERLCDGLAAPDGLHWSRAGQTKLGEALAAGPFADCG